MNDGKQVYLFREGNAGMKKLLGGKGANLAEMTRLNLPVPPGFTVTTEACNNYYAHGETLSEKLQARSRKRWRNWKTKRQNPETVKSPSAFRSFRGVFFYAGDDGYHF